MRLNSPEKYKQMRRKQRVAYRTAHPDVIRAERRRRELRRSATLLAAAKCIRVGCLSPPAPRTLSGRGCAKKLCLLHAMEARRTKRARYKRSHREAVARSRHKRRPVDRMRRRAREKAAGAVGFTRVELDLRMSVFGNRCWMCGGEFDHVDHVKPLAEGGLHTLSNLRPSCSACNTKKGASWPVPSSLIKRKLFD